MPGRIMSAQEAMKQYGKGSKKGNTITLKNSSSKRRKVDKNARVYHRGKGNFAEYSANRDSKKISRGATTLGGKGAVGREPYRHTSDYNRRGRVNRRK